MSRREAAVAVDLGGTNLRTAIVSHRGRILHWEQRDTPSSKQAIIDAIIPELKKAAELAKSEELDVIGVGISTGGKVDFRTGTIVDSTALITDWKDVHIRDLIEENLNIPTSVDNDGNCSAVAEKVFGKARAAQNFISLTLGTGIGGGIYVDGKILRGENNYAAEIGHVTVDAKGPKCSCGSCGCVELYSSGSGLARWAREEYPSLVQLAPEDQLCAKFIAETARSGNLAALDLLRRSGEMLGAAAAGWVDIFNPSMIVISGSLVGLGDPYFDAFQETARSRSIRPTADFLKIEFSDFNKEAGIIGAAALVLQDLTPDTIDEGLKRKREI
jgi:UDP-N-acetylglucosamine 2-epimerase/N-acetylmannosamine kinase